MSIPCRCCVAVLSAALIVGGCSNQPAPQAPLKATTPSQQAPVASRPVPVASTKAPVASRTTKEFTFTAQGGVETTATTQAYAADGEKHAVVFSPFLEKTDGNLYLAALQSLSNIYGKKRGLFQIADARMRENAAMGGNAICWRISNPTADYCIFPTKDSETGRIGALTVWVE